MFKDAFGEPDGHFPGGLRLSGFAPARPRRMPTSKGKAMRIQRLVPAVIESVLLLTSVAHGVAATEGDAGVYRMEVPSPEHEQPLDITIWYPAAATGGEEVTLGDSPFFMGTTARLDAPISDGRFPLVLLSHGVGLAGRAEALSWLAAPLAQRGFIVAAPTHPGNGGPDRSAAETMKLWLRPDDISRTLDAVEENSLLAQHLAPNEVGVLGLSMGGGTALALAGARFDPQLLAGPTAIPTPAILPSAAGSGRAASTSTPWTSAMPVATTATPVSASPWRSTRLRWMFSIGARYQQSPFLSIW
ncbi:MAG: alpha/beta fold hydrolase [Amaricoccus sp.]